MFTEIGKGVFKIVQRLVHHFDFSLWQLWQTLLKQSTKFDIFGYGFSLSNIIRMRQLYVVFPISAELPHKLSWTHLVELLKIDDPIERSFYAKQTMLENWSTTELIRQKKASLFLRLAVSKDKDGILKLAERNNSSL